jgi:ABC-type glycerol-3-phosphate transport system substrate-binding protein
MKKTITLISILMILLGLTACGSGTANTDPGTAQAVDSLLPTDYDNALPATDLMASSQEPEQQRLNRS